MILETIKDLYGLLKTRKKFWMAPIILLLVVLGALILVAQNPAIAPFVYTLF